MMERDLRFIRKLPEGIAVLQERFLFLEMLSDCFIYFGHSYLRKKKRGRWFFFFLGMVNNDAVPNTDVRSHLQVIFSCLENLTIFFLQHYNDEIEVNAGKKVNEEQVA